jgi:hypothetical protein
MGQVDARLTTDMNSHAKSCPECRAQLDFFQKIETIPELKTFAPPENWIREAIAKFEAVGTSVEPTIIGELLFDSRLHDIDAVRSPRLETRHMVFDLDTFEVDVALEEFGPQLNMVMGHILSKSSESPAELSEWKLELRVDANTYEAAPNELGEFIFRVPSSITGETLELRCTSQEGVCAIILIPC